MTRGWLGQSIPIQKTSGSAELMLDKGTGMSQKSTIAVIGATGKTGRRVADRLTGLGHEVRIGSRQAESPFVW